jgi:hypothetical protein
VPHLGPEVCEFLTHLASPRCPRLVCGAITGFAFQDNIEKGGDAMKLGFFRAQSHKIADTEQRKGARQPNGKMKFNGEILRRKGEPYLVDCCVTGSNEGTTEDPKFPLKNVSRNAFSRWLQD